MAGEKLISDYACKAAKPKESVYYLNDGAGLRLRIRPNGSKNWIFRYRLNAKEQNAGLGSYPTVTLSIARSKATEYREIVAQGRNPSIERKIKKTSSKATISQAESRIQGKKEGKGKIETYKQDQI